MNQDGWGNRVRTLAASFGKNSYLLFILFSCLVYLYFASSHIMLPGPQHDECFFVDATFGSPHQVGLFDVGPRVVHGWQVGDLYIPTMQYVHVGAAKAFFMSLVFKLFGLGVAQMRAACIALGLAVILLAVASARLIMGPWAACFTAALLCFDPTFIYEARLDCGPSTGFLFCNSLGLLFLLLYRRRQSSTVWLVGSCFMFGLAVYCKVLAGFLVLSLGIAILLFARHWIPGRKQLLLAVLAFLVGMAPLIEYNLPVPWTLASQISVLGGRYVSPQDKLRIMVETLGGTNLYLYVENVFPLRELLSTVTYDDVPLSADPSDSANMPDLTFFPWAVALAPFLIIWLALRRRWSPDEKITELVVISSAAYGALLLCLAYPCIFHAYHFITAYPFLQIAIALLLAMPFIDMAGKRLRAVALGAAGLIAVSSVLLDKAYLDMFAATGGVGQFSDGIYAVASWERENKDRHFYYLDMGIREPVEVCVGPVLEFTEKYRHRANPPRFLASDEELIEELKRNFRDPRAVFIMHSPRYTMLGRERLCFEKALEQSHARKVLLKTFCQRDGRPLVEAWRVDLAP